MNYKIFIVIFLFIYSCTTNNINKSQNKVIIQSETYSNKGFTLLFNEDLKKQKLINKKIEERSLIVFQKNLKKDTNIKITNLLNNKTILAKVGVNSKYPNFFNSVISKRIYEELELNESEPYVEITTISENSTFLAKKAKMYDEEKQVAEKAPVEGISINDLSLNKKKNKRIQKKDKFNYIIKIADFYYENTAIMMQKRIKDELNLNSSKISKISNTNFRVYLGPFDNLESLKNAFDGITPLNFENIEIIKL
jgi:hypothetical protein|tara:strand:+ start:115 stop:870 length:756 start_codon:yes stop_codon:yes gene_type:complete